MDDPERVEDESTAAKAGHDAAKGRHASHATPPQPTVQKTAYEQVEEQYPRYIQMLKMGVQREAVAQKMQADDVNPHHIRIFKAGPAGDASGKGSGGGTGVGGGGGADSGSRPRRPSKRRSSMRQVHWSTLDASRANLSVFGSCAEVVSFNTEEMVKMQELFGQEEGPESSAALGKGKKGRARPKTTTVLDSRRAANVSIMLKQFQSLLDGGYDGIVPAVLRLDPRLTADHLQVRDYTLGRGRPPTTADLCRQAYPPALVHRDVDGHH